MRIEDHPTKSAGYAMSRPMLPRAHRRRLAAVLIAATASLPATLIATSPAEAADCSDVELVFARATGERPGLGSAGTPLAAGLESALAGQTVSSHAVDYAAAANQRSAGPGATEMTTHVVQTAAACPNTTFVLGGYSQGASVTDIAIGLQTSLGRGETIPPELAPRVSAIVVFGNPLGLSGQTIEEASELYGAKTKSFCNTGDIFCGAGSSIAAHLAYPRDGSVDTAVEFAAAKVTATQSGAGAVGDVEVTAPEPAPAPQTERRGFWHRVFGF